MKTLPIGSIVSGTTRAEDTLPELVFLWEQHKPEESAIVDIIRGSVNAGTYEWDSGQAAEDIDILCTALEPVIPPYCYLGTHPGDGADLGVWVDWDALNDAVTDEEIVRIGDPADLEEIKREPVSRVPGTPSNVSKALFVNDHGNATLYAWTGSEWSEVWAIV